MDHLNRSRSDRIRRKRRRKRILQVLGVIILFIAGILTYYIFSVWMTLADSKRDFKTSQYREKHVELHKDPFAVLIMGTDARSPDEWAWRPDVLMIAAVNPKTKSILLVSVPRDSYVQIANTNGKKDKINSAAVWGHLKKKDEVENVRQTVETLFHIPIDEYARINFQGFTDLVDELGGVDVNIQFAFHMAAIGGDEIYFKPGPAHLNGKEALAYVRMRHQDPHNDAGRNERQHEVIAKLVDKLFTPKGIAKFPELAKALGRNFEFSFDLSETPVLADLYGEAKNNVHTEVIHYVPDRVKVGSHWADIVRIPPQELERISRLLQQQLEIKPKGISTPQSGKTDSSSSIKSNAPGWHT
jgi:LCP family protein required for cell wall assembly